MNAHPNDIPGIVRDIAWDDLQSEIDNWRTSTGTTRDYWRAYAMQSLRRWKVRIARERAAFAMAVEVGKRRMAA